MFEIYDPKKKRLVAKVSENGEVCFLDEFVKGRIEPFLKGEVIVREGAGEDFDEVELEDSMCFFGLKALLPGDPGHLQAALQKLSLLTGYEIQKRGK